VRSATPRRSPTLSGLESGDDRRPIDLHVHTTASDGGLTPGECVDEAARLGLAAIAITDHDTLDGNAEGQARGEELGVEVAPGVEISAEHALRTIHLLGYYPEPGAGDLEALLASLREHREERNPRILERLAALGCPVSYEEVAAEAGGEVIGRPHIAAVMIRSGYVRDLDQAFDRYLGKGAPAYVERWKAAPADSIEALLGARAVPVLAHPGTMGARSTDEVEAIVRQFVGMGLRGLEVYYHTHTARQTAAYLSLAKRCGLLVTGGTDFHGATKPDVQMGRGCGRLHVPYELLARLKEERGRL